MRIILIFACIACNILNTNAQDCNKVPISPLGYCNLTVIASSKQEVVLQASVPISTGVLIKFDSSYYIIEQQLDSLRYRAKFNKSIGTIPKIPNIGTQAEVIAYRAFDNADNSCFWVTLRNYFIKTIENADTWLSLDNAVSPLSISENAPFMLSVRNPPIEGYFCLMEIGSEQEVYIYFPNNRFGTDIKKRIFFKGLINLTYSIGEKWPAFANIFLSPDGKGKTTFVALISKTPRPLADFLPPSHQANYYTSEGHPIQPWEIGPGFYTPGAISPNSKGVDYIHGGEWAVSKLVIDVR